MRVSFNTNDELNDLFITKLEQLSMTNKNVANGLKILGPDKIFNFAVNFLKDCITRKNENDTISKVNFNNSIDITRNLGPYRSAHDPYIAELRYYFEGTDTFILAYGEGLSRNNSLIFLDDQKIRGGWTRLSNLDMYDINEQFIYYLQSIFILYNEKDISGLKLFMGEVIDNCTILNAIDMAAKSLKEYLSSHKDCYYMPIKYPYRLKETIYA